MYILYTDGGARPNPGNGGYGIWMIEDGNGCRGRGVYLGENVTNNQAEYQGLIAALEEVVRTGVESEVYIKTDSELVVKQVHGQYAVRQESLKPLHAKVLSLLKKVPHVNISHVPRRYNKMADALATAAIMSKGTVQETDLLRQSKQRIYPLHPEVTSKQKKRKIN